MPTIEAFYLGEMADLDPDESNYYSEDAENLVGMTFGGSDTETSGGSDLSDAYSLFGAPSPPPVPPLYESIVRLTLEDRDRDGALHENDRGGDGENISSGGVSSGLDSIIQVKVTITYADGTMARTEMGILQDESGRVFLIPNRTGSADNDVLDDHPIVSVHVDAIVYADYDSMHTDVEPDAFITCFVQGSLIETSQGAVDVAALAVGDLVQTMDHGLQPILWIGGRRVRAADHLRPIQISVGALGQGRPTHTLQVSPQHRILLRSKIAERMFGTPEVLIAAKKLLGLTGINLARQGGFVTYWHILFERHEIVFSHGVASESLYLGPLAQKTLGADAVAEVQHLFPELAAQFKSPKSARPIVQGKRQKQLLQRHIKNSQDVFQLM